MMQDKLNSHLEEIDKSAQDMYDCLMKQFKQQYGITEKLKAENLELRKELELLKKFQAFLKKKNT